MSETIFTISNFDRDGQSTNRAISLPPLYPVDLWTRIVDDVLKSKYKLIVLDDDPTGTQTVHDVAVLTQWTTDQIIAELRDPAALIYILTNSRSLPATQAMIIIESIMTNLQAALKVVPRTVSVISRSDSTLRGHFRAEIQAIQCGVADKPDGILVIPAFIEGGRFTLDDVHYVLDHNKLVPAAQTEYARDQAFGYTHSNLREWIAEKYGSQPVPEIMSISLATLRQGGPTAVTDQLRAVNGGAYVIVNAAEYGDLQVFVMGVMDAERAGKHFVARSAASYVRIRAGIAPRNLLTPAELRNDEATPGLVIAGSYIANSSSQIAQALLLPNVGGVEVHVMALVDENERAIEITNAISAATALHNSGQDVLIFTSRALLAGSDAADSLQIGQFVSAALVETVRRLPFRPGWIVAKGGITSSDVATAALGIKRAWVMGQVLPGVPVWRADSDSLWPGVSYIVFPGNVGDDSALARLIRLLHGG